ncbi:thiolase family protein [Rhizobium leguminosarum]|uniref:thiolase family protein n=1 Tax=Rhizobium leguminosarum TaxID=384 RepID=UPI00143F84AF|nr:acetyl-CoA C-acyltransferase [Rhizobium leguminosarum]NKL21781.1 acetyl-CoA C-acyltransferase [Rhizobium leguminosarum bv. viciae]
MTHRVVIIEPVRTAIGKFEGSLQTVPATDLGATVIKEAVSRSGIKSGDVTSVYMGNVIQAGNKMNPARQAALKAGLPVSAAASTVNRVCGSGAEALVSAAKDILLGNAELAVAGGMENMDRAPYLLSKARGGYRMGNAEIIDSMLTDGLHDAFSGKHSGWHTEDVISELGISREDQDRWAARSHKRFVAAQLERKFAGEIAPISIETRKGLVTFDVDEAPRPDTTIDVLSKLKPVFRNDGSITAGNAPGLNSGASAMIVADQDYAEREGLKPIARLVSYAVGAVEPERFAVGPIPAINLALQRAGWKLAEVERMEINEAYAAVPLAVMKSLGIPEDIVNVEGGAVAHGHPIGATGAILATRLLHSMRRDGLKKGLVALCIGGGQGISLAFELV